MLFRDPSPSIFAYNWCRELGSTVGPKVIITRYGTEFFSLKIAITSVETGILAMKARPESRWCDLICMESDRMGEGLRE